MGIKIFVLVEPFCLIGGNKTDYFHIIVYQKDKVSLSTCHCYSLLTFKLR